MYRYEKQQLEPYVLETEADQVHLATAASLAVAQAARPGLREMYQQPPREPRAKQHAFEQRSALVPAAAPPQLGRAVLR